MSINFQPVAYSDANYLKTIALFFEAFPSAQTLPRWVMQYRMRKGKPGFSILYDDDIWIGFIYIKYYNDIVFIKFLAISELHRSSGYGSKVMDSIKDRYVGQRIVLNIEALDKYANNYQQRVKRKRFYIKNGFTPAKYMIKEASEKQEMLIYGGVITKEEIISMYKQFLGKFLYNLLKIEVIDL